MRLLLTFVLAALSSAPLGAQTATRRLIIGFKPGSSAASRDKAVKSLGAQAVDRIEELGAFVAEVPQTKATFTDLADKALSEPAVEQVEEDVYVNWLQGEGPSFQGSPLPPWDRVRELLPRFVKTAAPLPALPPGILPAEVPWGIRRVDAAAAWSKTQGEGVRVAVIDTGIDAGHPDLRANVAGCYNALDSGASCFDDNGHGSHVSGTIAGALDGKGVVGVAPKARLYAVKVLNKEGGANLSSILKGLVWCGKNDMQVANMSLGAPIGSIFMRLAIKYAASKGVTLVAAAGNSGKSVEYPAGYPEVIAVAASDAQDRIADFSSRGPKVEFIAPGVDVKSSVPGGGFDFYDGTSMATPHVTGLAALAVARGASGPDAVRSRLKGAARSIGLSPSEQGAGMIDAALIAR